MVIEDRDMSAFTPVIPEGMEAYYEDYKFAPAVRAGDLLIVSGQLGSDADGALPPDPVAQMRNAFGAIDQILQSQGLGFNSVISLDSFHVGDVHEAFLRMIEAKAEFIPEPHPAWTAVGVNGLALPEALVEIKVTARFT